MPNARAEELRRRMQPVCAQDPLTSTEFGTVVGALYSGPHEWLTYGHVDPLSLSALVYSASEVEVPVERVWHANALVLGRDPLSIKLATIHDDPLKTFPVTGVWRQSVV